MKRCKFSVLDAEARRGNGGARRAAVRRGARRAGLRRAGVARWPRAPPASPSPAKPTACRPDLFLSDIATTFVAIREPNLTSWMFIMPIYVMPFFSSSFTIITWDSPC